MYLEVHPREITTIAEALREEKLSLELCLLRPFLVEYITRLRTSKKAVPPDPRPSAAAVRDHVELQFGLSTSAVAEPRQPVRNESFKAFLTTHIELIKNVISHSDRWAEEMADVVGPKGNEREHPHPLG